MTRALIRLVLWAGIILTSSCSTGHHGDPEAWSSKLQKIDREKMEQDSHEYWNALERL